MTKYLRLFFFLLIIFLVVTTSIKSTISSYNRFYHFNEDYEFPFILKKIFSVQEYYPIGLFQAYTGLDTGYGFFAPNVASEFLFYHEIYNSNCELIDTVEAYKFSTKEGLLKFKTFNGFYVEKLKRNPNLDRIQYLDIILSQLNFKIKSLYSKDHIVITKLYLHNFPTISEYRNGDTARDLILIENFNQ